MKIEHCAFNIKNAKGFVAWYHKNLDMPIHMEVDQPDQNYVAFFGEAPSLLEVYENPNAPMLNPGELHHLSLHLAFYSEDLQKDRDRLLNAGASLIEGEISDSGHGILMLRCPWGLAVQLCKRPQPLVS